MLNLSVLNDYLTLCKPRVVLLMLVTAWVGMYLASPYAVPWAAVVFGTLGIALAASSAAVFNHLIDRHIDLKMYRTATRPIACKRISPRQAMLFACILAISAGLILSIFVNILTTILTFSTILGYAVVYSLYLKHATPQNIVIGGLSGAMPPLLGWAAVSGDVNPQALLLVLIIFAWTPPHFWALAIYRVKDYTKAQVPMLPVTHGIAFTKLCLALYTFLLLAASLLPFACQMAGRIYLLAALILNGIFVYLALCLYNATGEREHRLAVRTFNYSIKYLFILFSALLIDHQFGV